MRNICKLSALWLLVLIAAVGTLRAQSEDANTPSQASSVVPVLISPGDLLDISVYDNLDLTQEVRVEATGQASLNLLGSIKLSGLTAQQAAAYIASEHEKRQYFRDKPQVTVLIKEYASQGISVTGEVNHPGVYPMVSSRSVLDAISLAGGLTSLADTSVTIKHRSGTAERVTVKLKADEASAALDANATVYPGDLVVVPRAGIVYVLGEVGRPGGFVMQDNGKITILQALAQAGGTISTASANGAYLMHKTDGGYVTSRVKVGDLLHGKMNDVELARNDILFIPGSKLKHLGQNTQSLAQAAASASVYHVVP